jgi:hypothetical protein
VTLQKIKYFGGWFTESSVVLDYIDPTVFAARTEGLFFNWMTPWVGQPMINPPNGDNMANGASPYFVNVYIHSIEVLITLGARIVGRCYDVTSSNR